MSDDKWYFDRERLVNTPSRRHGIPLEKEQAYLQTTANFIQEMGRRLSLPLLCINTAVLFTQRFYIFHSLSMFERFSLGAAALFLAAKVEEHPRAHSHICQMARLLGSFDKAVTDAAYIEDLLLNENVLITTLGFELQVQHPHQHILRLCNLIRVEKSLSQTAYILATYCLHLTQLCLIYKPIKIACLCVHMACKITGWEIPLSKEGKPWYQYDDASITAEILETLCDEFLSVLAKCTEKCKNKTLLANPENLVRKLVGNMQAAGTSKVSTPETSFSQNLVTLHDEMRKAASSFHSQSQPDSSVPMEWSTDEKHHDPHKHERKMNPTPTKNEPMEIVNVPKLAPQSACALPKAHVKTDRSTSQSDFQHKHVKDLNQRIVSISPSPALLMDPKTSHMKAPQTMPTGQHRKPSISPSPALLMDSKTSHMKTSQTMPSGQHRKASISPSPALLMDPKTSHMKTPQTMPTGQHRKASISSSPALLMDPKTSHMNNPQTMPTGQHRKPLHTAQSTITAPDLNRHVPDIRKHSGSTTSGQVSLLKNPQPNQRSLARTERPPVASSSKQQQHQETDWRRRTLSNAETIQFHDNTRKMNASSSGTRTSSSGAAQTMLMSRAGLNPVSWSSQPTLAPSTTTHTSGSIKISIPKSRIGGFQPSSSLQRSATPADLKTDKTRVYRIPITASMGSGNTFSEPKRFKPNPDPDRTII